MGEQLRARKDSNALGGNASQEPTSGDVGTVGFTRQAYPGERPAQSNSDIPSTKGSVGALGQDGTSVEAFKEQPRTIDAKSPKLPK